MITYKKSNAHCSFYMLYALLFATLGFYCKFAENH